MEKSSKKGKSQKVTKAKTTKNVKKDVKAKTVGNVVPINLTVGNKLGKSDKAATIECCGPYHQCHCTSMHVPA